MILDHFPTFATFQENQECPRMQQENQECPRMPSGANNKAAKIKDLSLVMAWWER